MSSFKKLALVASLGLAAFGSVQAAEEDTTFLLSNVYVNTVGTTAQLYPISNLGTDINGKPVQARVAGDTFVDDFYLEVMDPQTFLASLKASSGVSFASVTVFDLFNDIFPFSNSSFSSTSFTGSGLTLQSGLYALEVAGSILQNGGSYNGVIENVAAVPEPEQWAMMLVGLGALLGATRRKSGDAR